MRVSEKHGGTCALFDIEPVPVFSYLGIVMSTDRLSLDGDTTNLSECCSRSGGIDFLFHVRLFWLWSKWVLVIGDLVSVSVGGDGMCGFEPCGLLPRSGGTRDPDQPVRTRQRSSGQTTSARRVPARNRIRSVELDRVVAESSKPWSVLQAARFPRCCG